MKPNRINVLIACEESQAECLAFREMGFNAYSCDLQKARFKPPYHILDDVTPYLAGKSTFKTQDGKRHTLKRWHLIIAHPPCTYICKVSSVQMVQHGVVNPERFKLMQEGVRFFMLCLNATAPFVAVENPIPMRRAGLPRPSCYACPSWFGVKYTKKTLYWLRNLPPLFATVQYPNPKEFVRSSRGKYRSRTFPQMAKEIAHQWGQYVLNSLNQEHPK